MLVSTRIHDYKHILKTLIFALRYYIFPQFPLAELYHRFRFFAPLVYIRRSVVPMECTPAMNDMGKMYTWNFMYVLMPKRLESYADHFPKIQLF